MSRGMIKIVAVAALLLLAVTPAPPVSNAASPTDVVTTALRVSIDCQVTVTSRWSRLTFTPSNITNYVDVDVNGIDIYAPSPTTALRGSHKTVFQAIPTPGQTHTILAVTELTSSLVPNE